MYQTAADSYTCEKCNRILLDSDIPKMTGMSIESFIELKSCPVCYRLASLRSLRRRFFSTDDSVFPWYRYTDYILELPDSDLFLQDAIATANSISKIDYFKHDTRTERSNPDTVKIIASRDARLLALFSLQWANGDNLRMATLAQLNTMLTFCYRYAVKIRQHNYMYSAGYVWPMQPGIEQNTLTLGGHSSKDACFLPIPKIISKQANDSLILAYVPLYKLAYSQVISELRYEHEAIAADDITCYAGMLPDGNIATVKWHTLPYTNLCLSELEYRTFSKYL